MVERDLPKVETGVRFSSLAPTKKSPLQGVFLVGVSRRANLGASPQVQMAPLLPATKAGNINQWDIHIAARPRAPRPLGILFSSQPLYKVAIVKG